MAEGGAVKIFSLVKIYGPQVVHICAGCFYSYLSIPRRTNAAIKRRWDEASNQQPLFLGRPAFMLFCILSPIWNEPAKFTVLSQDMEARLNYEMDSFQRWIILGVLHVYACSAGVGYARAL